MTSALRIPLFIAFEGIDGSGTTTQCDLLCAHLQSLGSPVVRTREPGGTPLAECIRQLLLDPEQVLSDVTEMLLYAAARAQHVSEVIAPALHAGHPVVSDRFVASSLAYQGMGRGLGIEAVREVNRHAVAGVLPHLTIYLDVPTELASRRRQARAGGVDRIEMAGDPLQERVAQGYRLLAAADPAASLLVEGSRPPEVVADEVWHVLHERWPAFPYAG